MSKIQLGSEAEIDSSQIASATLEKKGAKISSTVVSVSSGDWTDLRVPEDSLIVRLKDGAEFAVRGEQQVKQAWDTLEGVKKKESLDFELSQSGAE